MRGKEYTRKDLIKYGLAFLGSLLLIVVFFVVAGKQVSAADVNISLGNGTNNGDGIETLDILFLFLFLAVVPSLLVMMTSFTRNYCGALFSEKCTRYSAVAAESDTDWPGSDTDGVLL